MKKILRNTALLCTLLFFAIFARHAFGQLMPSPGNPPTPQDVGTTMPVPHLFAGKPFVVHGWTMNLSLKQTTAITVREPNKVNLIVQANWIIIATQPGRPSYQYTVSENINFAEGDEKNAVSGPFAITIFPAPSPPVITRSF